MTTQIDQINAVLKKYPDPTTGKSIIEAGSVIALRIEDGIVKFVLEFASAKDAADFEPMRGEMIEELKRVDGVTDTQIVMSTAATAPASPPPNLKPRAPARSEGPLGIKKIYAIASGKGGVGKSTVTSNLAVALAAAGKKVGLLDADLYGPSQVMMMGVTDKPTTDAENRINPTVGHGVKMISLGQMVAEGEAVVWRGPMLMKALDQLLNQVNWGELDVLLIDLPPGTGDVQLSLVQKAKLSGVIVVTTPQDIALLDARRAISMFDRLEVPVIGMIENMATHVCTNCGHEEHIFGSGGAITEARSRDIPYLGALPLNMDVRTAGDQGRPIALTGEGLFTDIAARLIAGKMV